MDNIAELNSKVLEKFAASHKRIFRGNFSKNIKIRTEVVREFITNYNEYISIINPIFNVVDRDEKELIRQTYLKLKDSLLVFVGRLEIPQLSIPTDGYNTIEITDEEVEFLLIEAKNANLDTNMALTKLEFLGLCGRSINKTFEGEPLEVRAFIDSISLLEEFATTAELERVLISFVLSKLNGSVREKVPETPTNILEIKNAIKEKIRPESSDIIEGRFLALNEKRLDDFQNKAEKLAEQLKRALILEGVSEPKAKEMTIKSTIQLCRKKANTPDVRSVLSATSFDSPKEVIAKLITQINVVKDEKMADFYKKNNPYVNNRGNKSGNRGSFRGGRFQRRNNYEGQRNNENNQQNQFGQGNNRGRGIFRGRNYQNQRNRTENGTWNGHNNNNNNANNIRAFTGHSENSEAPQQFQLGAGPSHRQ
jgi:hypothetical protein